jgi:hypothetical protein
MLLDNMDTKRAEKSAIHRCRESEATYDLTVYYTDEELAFDDASALKILLVDGKLLMTLIPLK